MERAHARAHTEFKEGGGGEGFQKHSSYSNEIKEATKSPSPNTRAVNKTPDRRIEMQELLKSRGVHCSRRCAWKFPAARIEAAIAYFDDRADEEGLSPGWIVWRIEEPGPIPEVQPVYSRSEGSKQIEWLEGRWRRGKGTLDG